MSICIRRWRWNCSLTNCSKFVCVHSHFTALQSRALIKTTQYWNGLPAVHENEKDSNIQRQDDEKTTITLVNNTAISNDTRIKNNKLEEDNEGCDGPE